MNQNLISSKKVCVIGLGYIGLPTACIFADAGFNVHGVDINPAVLNSLKEGQCHLKDEPDLDKILKRTVDSGHFHVSEKPIEADLYLICVPTPFKKDINKDSGAGDWKADLTYVESAVLSLKQYLKKGACVVLESTSPPSTTNKILADQFKDWGFNVGDDIYVAYCPERVLPGKILYELTNNSRTIGGITKKCSQVASDYYKTFVKGEVILTTARVAETVKLVENSFRDVNIAFANEVSMFCDSLDIPHDEVIKLANQHPRVNILAPGPGVGGHCIAVDPWFLVEAAPDHTPLIKTAREVNTRKPRFVCQKIKEAINKKFKDTGSFQTVYLFGMSYKANVGDFRESPSIEIYHSLARDLGKMAKVIVVDPYLSMADDSVRLSLQSVAQSTVPGEDESNLHVRLVPHREFSKQKFTLDFSPL